MESAKQNTEKNSQIKPAGTPIGEVHSTSDFFGGKALPLRWTFRRMLPFILFFLFVAGAFTLNLFIRGPEDILREINYRFADLKKWWPAYVLFIGVIIAVPLLIRRRYTLQAESSKLKTLEQSGVSKSLHTETQGGSSIQFYAEGMQMYDEFLPWNQIAKIQIKSIVRVRRRLSESFGYRTGAETYYFISVIDTHDQHHTVSFKKYGAGYFIKTPFTMLKKLLKKIQKKNLLEEQKTEWIKGGLDEPQIQERLTNPFIKNKLQMNK